VHRAVHRCRTSCDIEAQGYPGRSMSPTIQILRLSKWPDYQFRPSLAPVIFHKIKLTLSHASSSAASSRPALFCSLLMYLNRYSLHLEIHKARVRGFEVFCMLYLASQQFCHIQVARSPTEEFLHRETYVPQTFVYSAHVAPPFAIRVHLPLRLVLYLAGLA
jgi:hypothetical protein